jgi:hypothetical protein
MFDRRIPSIAFVVIFSVIASAPAWSQITWNPDAAIEADAVGTNLSSQVATDDNGNAIAVWERRTAGATYIQASLYTPGGGWSIDEQIGRCGICDAAGMSTPPQIAMGSDGTAVVTWTRTDGVLDSVYAATGIFAPPASVPAVGWIGAAVLAASLCSIGFRRTRPS